MKNTINYTQISPQDKNALNNVNYQNINCYINFKDLLVKKPWGSEYLLFENSFCAIWILNIKYMENTSMHCHPNKDTSLVCLDGQVSCNTLNNSNKINTLDGIFLGKKIFHQTQSVSANGSYILEIETPVNKFDLVRLNDTYGRQGKEYEAKEHYTTYNNLTLSLQDNYKKEINNTILEIIDISSIDELNKYNDSTIVSIISEHLDCGKISRLSSVKDLNLFIGTVVLIISKKFT